MANFFFKNNLFTYGGAGSSLLRRLFPSNGKWGLLSSCDARASHCARLSQGAGSRAHRLQELWHLGSGVMAPGLPACEVFLDEGSNPSPALGSGFFTTKPPGKLLANFLRSHTHTHTHSHTQNDCELLDRWDAGLSAFVAPEVLIAAVGVADLCWMRKEWDVAAACLYLPLSLRCPWHA